MGKPCRQCGGTKPSGRGVSYCSDDCRLIGPPRAVNKRISAAGPRPRQVLSPEALERRRDREYRTRYGITLEQYNMMLAEQGGRCAICCNQPRTRRLAVDHDHKTGAVRGLLCSRCNKNLLGAAHESIEILQRAIDYLRRRRASR